MPLNTDNQRRLSDVQGVIQSVDPTMTPIRLAQHPRYPQVESTLVSYLGNIGLGYWISGDAAEQGRRKMARAILFLTLVMGGQQAIQQIDKNKEAAKKKSAQDLQTELTSMLALYRQSLGAGAGSEAIWNRVRWPGPPPARATQFDLLVNNPDDFPFNVAHVNFVLTNVDHFFGAIQLADLMERLEKVRVNIAQCLDAA